MMKDVVNENSLEKAFDLLKTLDDPIDKFAEMLSSRVVERHKDRGLLLPTKATGKKGSGVIGFRMQHSNRAASKVDST